MTRAPESCLSPAISTSLTLGLDNIRSLCARRGWHSYPRNTHRGWILSQHLLGVTNVSSATTMSTYGMDIDTFISTYTKDIYTWLYYSQTRAYFGPLTASAGIDVVLVCSDFGQRAVLFAVFRDALVVIRVGSAKVTTKRGKGRPTRSQQGRRPEATALLHAHIHACMCSFSLVTCVGR